MILILIVAFAAGLQGSAASNQIRALDSKMCLNVREGSMTRGADIITWNCDGSLNNQFEFLFPEDSKTGGQIKATQSGLCLNVFNADKNRGAKIITWDCGNFSNNQFRWIDVGDFKQIQSVLSGLCFNVYGASKDRGVGIVQWDCGDYANNRMEVIGSDIGGATPDPPLPPPPPTRPAPPPPDCPFRDPVGASYYPKLGYNVSPGNDITVRQDNSVGQCAQDCITCEGCVAFVFDPNLGKCHLKDNTNLVPSDDQSISTGVMVF